MNNNESLFISAGDISGDIHAGTLVKQIKQLSPDTKIIAVGGNELRRQSDTFIEDIVNINAFGFFPVKQYFFLKQVFKKVEQYLVGDNICKVVLIDYYGFNIHLAELAHKLKIPVYYYVTPQIWASRKFRIKKIAKYVKRVFPILPFEKNIYLQEGIDAVFEGNPLIDIVPQIDKDKNLSEHITIGLFAGSRKNTIKRHLPVLLDVKEELKKKINAKFILFSLDKINGIIPEDIEVKYGNNFEERKKIDIAVCPSGTVSLENALMGIPMVVMYKLSWANYLLARLIVQVKYITLVNILRNREIVPEYIQHKASARNISEAVIKLLNIDKYNQLRQDLLQFRKELGAKNVAYRVAQNILGDNNGL